MWIPLAEMQRELIKDYNRSTFWSCNSSLEGVQMYTPAWFELHWVGPRWWWRGAVNFFNQLSSNLLFWQHLCFIMSHFVFHSNEIKKRQVWFLGISENCFKWWPKQLSRLYVQCWIKFLHIYFLTWNKWCKFKK